MKCPKCKKQIDFLDFSKNLYYSGEVKIIKGKLEYVEEPNNDFLDNNELMFNCPKCSEELFNFEEDVLEFLRGGR